MQLRAFAISLLLTPFLGVAPHGLDAQKKPHAAKFDAAQAWVLANPMLAPIDHQKTANDTYPNIFHTVEQITAGYLMNAIDFGKLEAMIPACESVEKKVALRELANHLRDEAAEHSKYLALVKQK